MGQGRYQPKSTLLVKLIEKGVSALSVERLETSR
jgi:hypothetical protein